MWNADVLLITVFAMRLPMLSLAAMLWTGACATAPEASLADRTLPFGCDDVVVIGNVTNGSYRPVESADDLLGHGWITATVNVRRVIRGPQVAPVLPVRYFAHAAMRENRDFMLVLRRTGTGFEITTGQSMSLRPRIAGRCE
jgi:hypothetical protein